tara:strand:- start:352 stop:1560 length:1209 start_codon:yes stop_codon:yes gene_type:complete
MSKFKMIGFKMFDYQLKIINLLLIPISSLFIVKSFYSLPLKSQENLVKPNNEYIKNIPNQNFYILGPGDIIAIKVREETKELNGIYSINGEGIINLKRLNNIYVEGLTITELANILNIEFSKFVKNPEVQVKIKSYRPVKIYVDGEVLFPGLHILPGSLGVKSKNTNIGNIESLYKQDANTFLSSGEQTKDFSNESIYFPSVFDGIRKSGGITHQADLTNIRIIRKNSLTNGGGKIETSVNLLETLNLKNDSQNIRIFDGDFILLNKGKGEILSQVSKAIKSNLNPRFINIYLGGRVENPGALKISKNASLVEAIQMAGGPKIIKGKVNFIRYKGDGELDKRKFKLNINASRNSYKNPLLRDGDVIYIGKSGLNIANEIIQEISSPIQGIVSTYSLYQIISE